MSGRRARWCVALAFPLVALGALVLVAPAADARPAGVADTIDCTEKRGALGQDWLWPDKHESVDIPDDAPQWWRDEIARENGVDGGQACDLAEHPPTKPCADRDADDEIPGLLPDGCWGTYPSDQYVLSWESGNPLDPRSWPERTTGWITDSMFSLGKGATKVSLWLVDYSTTFDVRDYSELMTDVSEKFDTRIIGPWKVADLVWLILIGYVGYSVLRGRLHTAGGELLMSIVLLALATVLFTNREMYMNEVARTIDLASTEMLVAANDPDDVGSGAPDHACNRWTAAPDPGDAAVGPMLCRIHVEFVERPTTYLNWGQDVDAACTEVLNNIASTGYSGGGWPARYVKDRQDNHNTCTGVDVGFNRDVGTSRVGAAALAAAVQVAVAIFLGLPAVTGIVATFMVAVLFAFTPFVLAVAALPGSGRRLAWSWAGALLQAFLTAVAMALMLSLLVLSVSSILDRTHEFDLIHRWLLVLIVVVLIYYARLHVMRVARAFSSRVADTMTRTSPASANWQGGQQVGIDFAGIDRAALIGATAAGAAALFAGQSVHRRWVERRVASRALQNLEIMERSREGLADEYRFDTYRYGDRPDGEPGHVRAFAGSAAGAVGGGGAIVAGGGRGGAAPGQLALPAGGGFGSGSGGGSASADDDYAMDGAVGGGGGGALMPTGDGPGGGAPDGGAPGGGAPGGMAGAAGGGAAGALGASGVDVQLPGSKGPQDGEFRIRHQRVAKMRPAPYKPAWHVRARPWRPEAKYYRASKRTYERHRDQVTKDMRREELRFSSYANKVDYFKHRGHPG